MVAATRTSRRAETPLCQQAPRGPLAAPTGTPGGDGVSPCSATCSAQGGPDSRHPQRPTRDPPRRPCARGHPEVAGNGCCSQPGRPGCTLSPLKGSEMSPQTPRQQIPGGTCGGAAPIPSSSPLRDAVTPTRTEGGSRAAPSPVVPLLADPGGGMQPPPRPAPRRWRGQPAQVAPRHGRLGPAACGVPGKGSVPAGLRGPGHSLGSLTAHGGQSRGVPAVLCPVLDPALQHRHPDVKK